MELRRKNRWRQFFVLFMATVVVFFSSGCTYNKKYYDMYNDGYYEGYEDGFKDASEEYYFLGMEDAFEDGYVNGHTDGYLEAENSEYGSLEEKAIEYARKYSGVRPEEAMKIVRAYQNQEPMPDGKIPSEEEYHKAVEALYRFYEYFYYVQ